MINCIVCKKQFDPKGTRTLTCSDKCYAERRRKQFDEYNRRARQKRAMRGPIKVPCKICSVLFERNSNAQIYCSDECAAVGLEQAIERQRQRRAAAKEATCG